MFTGRTCKAAEMLTLRKTPTYKTLTSQIFMSAKLCYQQKSPPHTHTDCVKHFPVYSFELGSFQMRGGGGYFVALSILESAKQRNTRFHSLSSFACANFGLCRYDYKEEETGQNCGAKVLRV